MNQRDDDHPERSGHDTAHPAYEDALAGGTIGSEGPGAPHRYRALVMAGIGLLVLVLGMVISYSGAFGQPTPNHLPIAVAGDANTIVHVEQQDGLAVTVVKDAAAVRRSVLDRDTVGGLIFPQTVGPVTTVIASGASKTTALAVTKIGAAVAAQAHTTATVTDVAPLPASDPAGTLEFYVVLFLGIGASLGATLFGRILGTVDTARGFVERGLVLLIFTGLLSAGAAWWENIVLGGITHQPWQVLGLLWLYTLAVGGAVTGVASLLGSLASIGLIIILVVFGNSSSGGPVGTGMQDDFFQGIALLFPQGAALDALRSVVYFDGAAAGWPIARLAIWAVAGGILALVAMAVRSAKETRGRRQPHTGAHVMPRSSPDLGRLDPATTVLSISAVR